MLNDSDSYAVRQELLRNAMSPFLQLAGHIRISIDGNQWCVLYGENLQDGVAGFGDSPANAAAAFDQAWFTKLPELRKLAEEARE
jgi:hypothetical protein